MESNPLLSAAPLPAFSQIEAQHVEPAIDRLLAAYRAGIDALIASKAPRTWETVIAPQEALDDALSRAWAPVSHLHSVKDHPALRDAYSNALEKITELTTDLGQNRQLYEAVQALATSPDYANLTRAQKTIIEDSIRDFQLSGVALEEPARSRFKAIATEHSKISTEFEQAVLDATDAWHKDVGLDALKGIPESSVSMMREAAEEAKVEGYRITLKQPSYVAVLTYADDRALRRELYEAYATRASDQGPHAGKYDNSARIETMMSLRHEAAVMLGFRNAAEESLATKMAPSAEKVLEFLHDLARRAKPIAERERAELEQFAREECGLDALEPWDVAYVSEKLRLKLYDLSEEAMKPYFPLEAVLEGLYAVVGRVFGVSFRRRDDVDVWHPDVRYYDVIDENGAPFAGLYLDAYARSSKRGGAWMDVCRSRYKRDQSIDPPIAFLTCNFAPPTADTPALLTHDDVITLFHEFGHGLHHLLTEVDYPSAAGISGVEWDAVELPSQFMENFAWQREALALFAKHWKTGEPLPDELFEKMTRARYFHAGLFLVRQLEFALLDFRLHLEYDPARGSRLLELLQEVRNEVAVIMPPPWHRFPHSFTHIFSGGYAAGYYSYLWAEVLSADAFSRFEEEGIFDPKVGAAFRRAVLAVGGSRPALESFVEFRGREPDSTALLRSYGLAA